VLAARAVLGGLCRSCCTHKHAQQQLRHGRTSYLPRRRRTPWMPVPSAT
jgi:hypothetical protein